jgi:tRNA threonylcarbamoyladenosine biosynthesis protein TsaE
MSRSTLSLASSDPAATERIADSVARSLAPGDVVHLVGELGAGKTTFIRAACRALGVTQPVTSPTYTVGNRYAGSAGPVSHIDLYRSRGVTDEEWADLEPYFDGATCFVEWPAAGVGALPAPSLTISIRLGEGDARLIELEPHDARLAQALGHSLS